MLRLLVTRRWVGLTLVAIVVALACVRLGIWQLHRGEARSHYNATLHARATQRPVPVDEVLRVGARPDDGARFRRVTATGRYDAAGTLLARNRVQNGVVGYEVLVPLVTARGTLLVDRGWIALAGDAAAPTAVPPAPTGSVTVTGRLRDSAHVGEDGLRYTTRPEPSVASIDALAIGRRLGTATYGTYVESTAEQPPGTGSLAPLPEPDDQNSGLNYAYFVQWEIFAGIALVGWFLLLRREAADDADGPADGAPDPAAGPGAGPDGVSPGQGGDALQPDGTMTPHRADGSSNGHPAAPEREDQPWPA